MPGAVNGPASRDDEPGKNALAAAWSRSRRRMCCRLAAVGCRAPAPWSSLAVKRPPPAAQKPPTTFCHSPRSPVLRHRGVLGVEQGQQQQHTSTGRGEQGGGSKRRAAGTQGEDAPSGEQENGTGAKAKTNKINHSTARRKMKRWGYVHSCVPPGPTWRRSRTVALAGSRGSHGVPSPRHTPVFAVDPRRLIGARRSLACQFRFFWSCARATPLARVAGWRSPVHCPLPTAA